MEKLKYVAPAVETVEMESAAAMLQASVNSNLEGTRYGGKASSLTEPFEVDANRNNDWDLW